MKQFAVALSLFITFWLPVAAQEGARDADAVLNRCGTPLKGDDTVYTNELSTRTLKYERGTLVFNRVGNEGWKFDHGSHKKQQNLNAQQMAAFLPCLPLALADSAKPAPLKKVSAVDRIEVSARHSYQQVILYTIIGLVLLGVIFYVLSRRKPEDPDDE